MIFVKVNTYLVLLMIVLLGSTYWVVEEQYSLQILFDEEVIQWIQSTKALHANYSASNVLCELEVQGHLAALRKRTILTK